MSLSPEVFRTDPDRVAYVPLDGDTDDATNQLIPVARIQWRLFCLSADPSVGVGCVNHAYEDNDRSGRNPLGHVSRLRAVVKKEKVMRGCGSAPHHLHTNSSLCEGLVVYHYSACSDFRCLSQAAAALAIASIASISPVIAGVISSWSMFHH